tara:strand:- start:2402 stop:2680 length:279 start_codon:yes stop_codon:yes gene_type:complete
VLNVVKRLNNLLITLQKAHCFIRRVEKFTGGEHVKNISEFKLIPDHPFDIRKVQGYFSFPQIINQSFKAFRGGFIDGTDRAEYRQLAEKLKP